MSVRILYECLIIVFTASLAFSEEGKGLSIEVIGFERSNGIEDAGVKFGKGSDAFLSRARTGTLRAKRGSEVAIVYAKMSAPPGDKQQFTFKRIELLDLKGNRYNCSIPSEMQFDSALLSEIEEFRFAFLVPKGTQMKTFRLEGQPFFLGTGDVRVLLDRPDVPNTDKVIDQRTLAFLAISGSQDAFAKVTAPELISEIAKLTGSGYIFPAALEKITDVNVLTDVAQTARDPRARVLAASKLPEQSILIDLAKNHPESKIRSEAIGKLKDQQVLLDVIKNENNTIVRMVAVGYIEDQKTLLDIAMNDEEDDDVRMEAVIDMKHPSDLEHVARNSRSPQTRYHAVSRITDQAARFDIAKTDPEVRVRQAALRDLTNPMDLAEIAIKDASLEVATAAMGVLWDTSYGRKDSYYSALEVVLRRTIHERIREVAASKLPHTVLANIARSDKNPNVRVAAVKGVTSPELLGDIASRCMFRDARIAAIGKLLDKALLSDLATKDADPRIRAAAKSRLTEL